MHTVSSVCLHHHTRGDACYVCIFVCALCLDLRVSRLTGLRGCDPPSSVSTLMH